MKRTLAICLLSLIPLSAAALMMRSGQARSRFPWTLYNQLIETTRTPASAARL